MKVRVRKERGGEPNRQEQCDGNQWPPELHFPPIHPPYVRANNFSFSDSRLAQLLHSMPSHETPTDVHVVAQTLRLGDTARCPSLVTTPSHTLLHEVHQAALIHFA
jgi:hypothetical protein